MSNGDWEKVEYWYSPFGQVEHGEGGEWFCWVRMKDSVTGTTLVRVRQSFPSAEVAMKAVERTYDRENNKK